MPKYLWLNGTNFYFLASEPKNYLKSCSYFLFFYLLLVLLCTFLTQNERLDTKMLILNAWLEVLGFKLPDTKTFVSEMALKSNLGVFWYNHWVYFLTNISY